MDLRTAAISDRQEIQEVYLRAFPISEKEAVASVALSLLERPVSGDSFTLVAAAEDGIVGTIGFSPLHSKCGSDVSAAILSPLAVLPNRQKMGIGRKLIEEGLLRLGKAGVELVFVYGDPEYYGRFGFSAQVAKKHEPPQALQYPEGWLARPLSENFQPSKNSFKLQCVPELRRPDLW